MGFRPPPVPLAPDRTVTAGLRRVWADPTFSWAGTCVETRRDLVRLRSLDLVRKGSDAPFSPKGPRVLVSLRTQTSESTSRCRRGSSHPEDGVVELFSAPRVDKGRGCQRFLGQDRCGRDDVVEASPVTSVRRRR